MKKLILAILALLTTATAFSQAMYRMYPSDVLDEERQVKILKPRNYSKNPEKTYPLIMVLDADYLFEPVAGNVDYLSYWDQMPESFVVGVNMNVSRHDDTSINPVSGFPEERAQKFMDFFMELRGTMMEEYRVAPFTVIVARDISANLAAFYLLRKKVFVNGFIQIAPEYSDLVEENLVKKLGEQTGYNYFYVATPEKSDQSMEFYSSMTDSLFAGKKNLNLKHEMIEGSNQYSVAGEGIVKGLQYVFKEYGVIDEQALYKEGVEEDIEMAVEEGDAEEDNGKKKKKKKSAEDNIVDQLLEKYKMIEEVYGVNMKLRLVDVATITKYLQGREEWDQLVRLGELAAKEYPDLLYGNYVEGLGYEGMGREPRAVKAFNKAYTLQPAAGITQTDVLDKIESLQEVKD